MSENTEKGFASANLTAGQLNATVKKLGGEERVKRFLRGELKIVEVERGWREEDGVIYFSVTSSGITGKGWISRLESQDFEVRKETKEVLLSKEFIPTDNITYEIAVLRGTLFHDDDRIAKNICKEAKRRQLSIPNVEIACLIRENFSDKDLREMGIWYVVTMHESIKDSNSNSRLLNVGCLGYGSWLRAHSAVALWNDKGAFAFELSQG